jgi:transcriptional regulator with XRE-family HTH domain
VLAIRLYRERRGISQSVLGALTDVNQTTISQIERGFLCPDDPLLQRIGDVLGVSPSFLLLLPVPEGEGVEA